MKDNTQCQEHHQQDQQDQQNQQNQRGQHHQYVVPPGASVDCLDLQLTGQLLIVAEGDVVLESSGGALSLRQGAHFVVDGLSAPVLWNPSSRPVTIASIGRTSS